MTHAILLILLCAAITWILRAAPFVLFGHNHALSPRVHRMADALPPAIMAILVAYCLRSVTHQAFGASIPLIIAAVFTALLQLRFRRAPLSIAVGTALYMLLLRYMI